MRKKGKEAEDRAIAYLRSKGYKIIERNYFTRFGEIDVIAQKGEVIVFIEVKSNRSWEAEYSFTPHKAKRLYKSALIYLSSKGLKGRPFRFDLIAIGNDSLRHYESVLEEGGAIG